MTMSQFIPRTVFPNYNVLKANLKGHQVAAMTRISQLAPQVDFVIELRDARAPIATANPITDTILAQKPKLIVYSKSDMSNVDRNVIKQIHTFRNENYMFMTKAEKDIRQLITKMKTTFITSHPYPPLGFRVMVVGYPNLGKSTLINGLRRVGLGIKAKVARTGNNPGITTKISTVVKLTENPDIFVYDTPGVMVPQVKDEQTMLTMSLVGCVNNSFVDPYIQADYLLYLLNLQNPHIYYRHSPPTNSIDELLQTMATKSNKASPKSGFNLDNAARLWVYKWQNVVGYKSTLDLPVINRDAKQLCSLLDTETDRFRKSALFSNFSLRLGDDGTATARNRQRTAKDRAADISNRLFKL